MLCLACKEQDNSGACLQQQLYDVNNILSQPNPKESSLVACRRWEGSALAYTAVPLSKNMKVKTFSRVCMPFELCINEALRNKDVKVTSV